MSFSTQDTIVAVATPPGRGGIGVVRLSGPAALAVAQALITHRDPLQPRHATFSRVRLQPEAGAAADAAAVDQVVATFFPSPHSYTGEDVVELSAHGNPVVLGAIVSAAIAAGARLAEPGEFTLRAYLSGRIDLVQAEAVNDLIDAVTPLQARAAFDQLDGTLTHAIGAIDATLFDLIARLEASVDFPEEGYHFVEPGALAQAIDELLERTAALLGDGRRGRLIREGLTIAIVGEPNGRQVEPVQRARRRFARDRHRGTRHDPRFGNGGGRHRGVARDAGGHGGAARYRRSGGSRGCCSRAQAMAVADLVLLSRIDRARDRASTGTEKFFTLQIKAIWPRCGPTIRAVPVSATLGDGLELLRRRIAVALDVDPPAIVRR